MADEPTAAPTTSPLAQRLERLRAEHGERVPIGAIGELVTRLAGALADDAAARGHHLYGEIEALARYIAHAKEEIGALCPEDIRSRHLPAASGELDAIASHLEQATGEILDAAEVIETEAGGLEGEPRERIGRAVTRVYEACNFQDLSGQRIAKVVGTLQHIESRLDAMICAFGPVAGAAPADDEDRREGDARLLNGPKRQDVANTQADIDALLAELE